MITASIPLTLYERKMNMKKRILSLALALAMCLSLVPVASAAYKYSPQTFTGNDCTVTFSNAAVGENLYFLDGLYNLEVFPLIVMKKGCTITLSGEKTLYTCSLVDGERSILDEFVYADYADQTITPEALYQSLLDRYPYLDTTLDDMVIQLSDPNGKTMCVLLESAAEKYSYLLAPPADPFSDVTPDDWYYQAVNGASRAGIIAGNADGSFNPSGTLTWAQTITFAVRLMQKNNFEPIYGAADQTGKNWYDIYVDYAMENGIISTVAANPNAKITRGEAAVIFAKVFEMYEQVNDVPDGYFTDVPKGSAAYDAVYFLAEAGVCNGMGNGTFGVNATFKRSEVATIVARIAGLVNPAVIAQ